MVRGLPRICINTIGTFNSATVESICSSNVPPEISFTISAPASMAALATAALFVSMEIGTASFWRILSIIGITRSNSWFTATFTALGRVDSPPISIMSTPFSIILSAWNKADCNRSNSPPSLKLSGVTLIIPMR